MVRAARLAFSDGLTDQRCQGRGATLSIRRGHNCQISVWMLGLFKAIVLWQFNGQPHQI